MFLITATMLIGAGTLYVCFADSTLQDWNGHSPHAGDKEMQLLNEEKPPKDTEQKLLEVKNKENLKN